MADLKSWLIGYTLGVCGKPLPVAPKKEPTAFAVFSADDGSLVFYNNADFDKVTKGGMYRGKVVTEIYPGVDDTSSYNLVVESPWYSIRESITSVSVAEHLAVKSTYCWFINCTNLKSVDLTNLDTSEVTNAYAMFADCSSLTAVNLGDMDTSKLESMLEMFSGCSSLTTLDLSSFTCTSSKSISYMFMSCRSLKTIFVSDKWGTPRKSSYVFHSCNNLVGGNGTAYDSSHTDSTYARVDNPPDAPGYFTYKQRS